MRKNTLTKAFALLVILAMLLPCIPVLASAEVTTAKRLENVSVADAFQYLENNCKSTTEENTYILDSTDDLAYFMACGRGTATASPFTGNIRFESCTVKLGADITWNEGTASATGFQPKNAGDTVYLWEPYFSAATKYGAAAEGGFKGTFDGCGHTISGLYINTTTHAGFFAALSGVTVKNIRFENCYVENAASSDSFVVGMVAGAVCTASTFEEIIVSNCHLKGATCVGGIIGGPTTNMDYASAVLKLTDCVIDAKSTVTASVGKAGGIMGAVRSKNAVTLTRCINYATTTTGATTDNRNGLIGYDASTKTKTVDCATIGSKYFYNGEGWQAGKKISLTDPIDGVMSMEIEGVQTKENADTTKFDARFVASVLLGSVPTETTLVGFEFSQLSEYVTDATNVKTQNCTSVYTSIKTNFGGTDLTADDFDADYLGTLVITGIPKTGAKSILIRAWYQVDGGAKQYGNYALVTFVNGQVVSSKYLTEYTVASVMLATSYNEDTYNMTELFPNTSDLKVKKKGVVVSANAAPLDFGRNYFKVSFIQDDVKIYKTVAIARRAGHRVVFNSNGGSYIAPQSVADGGKLTNATPTRVGGYEFLGWYRQDGTLFDFSNATVTNDMMLVAHWKAPAEPAETVTSDAHVYNTSSAAINVVWKDYANAFSARPASVTCTLSDGTDSYKVVVTENGASFANGAPAGAMISAGAGNWTVKITGLDTTKEYTFTADDLNSNIYEKQQSGTAVTYTLNGYNPMLDDSAWLMTQNGRLYDYAGNVVVLKGVVTYNVGWNGFEDNVSMAALARLQSEGVNCIRVTVFVENAGNNSYHTADEQRRAELRTMLKVAIDNASSLGMYCIVDWGILGGTNKIEMTDEVNASAKELFVTLATEYKDNPFVIYEICNEPEADTWSSKVVPYAKDVIAAIRAHSNALVILAPDAAATNLSEYSPNPGDDPIDKPLDTALSYSVAYTFHCYAASHKYEATSGTYYGWKIKDALDAGLTLVWTEFSPAELTMGSELLTIDEAEANKFLNVILENDMSFMLFRYMSGGEKDSAQYMFQPNHTDSLNNGTWTYDMLQNSGVWFYDNALNSDGFIKNADFE